MTLVDISRALSDTTLSHSLRDSQWGFAVIEMFHLIGLALFGGALLVTVLRLVGAFLAAASPQEVIRDLVIPLAAGLGLLVLSGTLLFVEGPLRYVDNAAFRAKLILLSLAVGASMLMAAFIRAVPARAHPTLIRAGALATLALWLGVGIAGRVIGVL